LHVRGPSALGALLEAGGELADELPTRISRPAVSRHLRLLKRAGLVADRAEGTRRVYRLDDEGIVAVREYLEHVWGASRGPVPASRREHQREDRTDAP
jgi:DNA-binding transcriptional ArsR family regulator